MDAPPPGKRWHTREDSGIRLDREGRWWHDDELVEHPKIVEAFNTGLQVTEDGRYKLVFGWDWCFVTVEDAAYRVVAVDVADDGGCLLRLSDRSLERLDPSTLTVEQDGVLSCRVKEKRAKARFTRDAQFAIGDRLEERNGEMGLCLGGRWWPLRHG